MLGETWREGVEGRRGGEGVEGRRGGGGGGEGVRDGIRC